MLSICLISSSNHYSLAHNQLTPDAAVVLADMLKHDIALQKIECVCYNSNVIVVLLAGIKLNVNFFKMKCELNRDLILSLL